MLADEPRTQPSCPTEVPEEAQGHLEGIVVDQDAMVHGIFRITICKNVATGRLAPGLNRSSSGGRRANNRLILAS